MDRYLLLTVGRSGSNFLSTILSQYYKEKYFLDVWEIEFFGTQITDLKHPYTQQKRKDISNEYNVSVDDTTPVKELFELVYPKHLPILKGISWQLFKHGMLINILNYYNKPILLLRKDKFELALSFAIMKSTEVVWCKDDNSVLEYHERRCNIDPIAFVKLCDIIYNGLRILENYRDVAQVIYYEDICNMEPHDLLRYIGITDSGNLNITQPYRKLSNIAQKKAMILNFNEIRDIYEKTPLYIELEVNHC